MNISCTGSQGELTHHAGPGFRHLSFIIIRVFPEEIIRYRDLQNGIPQEFQTLIVLPVLVFLFIGIRTVGHSQQQKFFVLKMIGYNVLQDR